MVSRFIFSALLLGLLIPVSAQEPVRVLTYLEPYRSIEMASPEAGVIQAIEVREGDAVSEGQILVRLDSAVIEARRAVALAQANNEGRIAAAQAERDLADKRYKLLQNLQRSSSNRAELERQEATLQGAEGNLLAAQEDQKTAQLNVKQIETEIERRTLRSPIDGIVVEITKDVAETVSPGTVRDDAYLVRIVQVDRLKAIAHVPADAAIGLKKGNTLPIEIEGGQPIAGEIEFVSPIIHPSSNTVAIRLVMENRDQQIRGGTTAEVLVPSPDA